MLHLVCLFKIKKNAIEFFKNATVSGVACYSSTIN